ncbi:protein of unknown function [Candidatus Nitrosocosmicus franklandus]|uniref:Uncharacterized protein n=1 Tax=Candidatus Nitrosocosmicus franklandianus TaxID=1798806 RepID=A0A484I7B1_9ARCH|nr:protein of unknown function [Candidatus Nitrosocosmicus franklandus]
MEVGKIIYSDAKYVYYNFKPNGLLSSIKLNFKKITTMNQFLWKIKYFSSSNYPLDITNENMVIELLTLLKKQNNTYIGSANNLNRNAKINSIHQNLTFESHILQKHSIVDSYYVTSHVICLIS